MNFLLKRMVHSRYGKRKTPTRLNPPTSPKHLKGAPEDWNLSISLSIEGRTPPSPAFFEAILYTNRIEKTSRKNWGGGQHRQKIPRTPHHKKAERIPLRSAFLFQDSVCFTFKYGNSWQIYCI
jgi:hypothetical protein